MSKTYKYILDFVANNQQAIQAMSQTERKITEVGNKANSAKSQLGGMFDGAGKQLLALGSFAAISAGAKALVSNVIDVRKEFEKYEAVLTTSLGSHRKAQTEMQMLQQFASSTPFALSELTGAYVKLTNYGLKPNLEEMRKYGDLASSVGKGFDQLAEAAADAVTGEFERLKEFGIKAKAEGDKIVFTFKGQATAVNNSAEAIKTYITGLGELNGVAGSMASISGTLGGKISNLGDAWDGLMNSMGAKSSGVMVGVIDFLTTVTNKVSGLVAGEASAETRGNGIITRILGDLPKDRAEAQKKIEKELGDLKNTLTEYQSALASEIGSTDVSNLLFRKEHADRIHRLNREVDMYAFAIDGLVKEYQKEIAAEKAAADQKAKDLAAANARKISVAGLTDQLKALNEIAGATNASDTKSLQVIYAKIAAVEKQIAAIEKLKTATIDAAKYAALEQPKNIALTAKGSGRVTARSKEEIDKDKPDIEKWSKTLGNMNGMLDRNKKKVDDWKNELVNSAQTISSAFAQGFSQMGQSIVNSLGLAKDGLEGFIGGLASTAMQFIAMMLAKSLAAAIFSAEQMAALTGPGAIFSAPVLIAQAVAGVMGAFAAIPKFANGGIAFGPTMGLMGEYPGARSNPEVIAPLSKLKAMIGGGSGDHIILQPSLEFGYNGLRVQLNRVDANARKRTGKRKR
jgi:hypothetical protein